MVNSIQVMDVLKTSFEKGNIHQQTLIFGYVTLCDTTAAMALCAKGTLLQVTTDKFKYKIK